MNINIINEPDYAKDYEFVVVLPIEDKGNYLYQASYIDGHAAEICAKVVGGIIIHNVRIQGFRKPEKPKPKKYYKVEYTAADVFDECEDEQDAVDRFWETYENCLDGDPVVTEITEEEYNNFYR